MLHMCMLLNLWILNKNGVQYTESIGYSIRIANIVKIITKVNFPSYNSLNLKIIIINILTMNYSVFFYWIFIDTQIIRFFIS